MKSKLIFISIYIFSFKYLNAVIQEMAEKEYEQSSHGDKGSVCKECEVHVSQTAQMLFPPPSSTFSCSEIFS